jgi:type IV secretory pathway VirB2 component (pilin)
LPVINKNIKLIVKYVFGPVVFCILAVSIYRQVASQAGWQNSLQQISVNIRGAGAAGFIAVGVLMFINWGLEARKWQLAMAHLHPISFGRSFKAVFTGTTLAFFTPNRIGEYFGRILYIPDGKRIRAISLTIVCSIAQLLVTLIAGIWGLILFRKHLGAAGSGSQSVLFWLQLVLWLSVAGAFFLAMFYFRLSWLARALEKLFPRGRLPGYVKVLEEFNATVLLRILSLSLFRYIVFLLQYFLLFDVFDVALTVTDTFTVVSVMFVVLAIAPTIAFLTDLGIRAKASIELVQFFSTNVAGILATALGIWIINLVIPALIGSLLVLGLKLNDYTTLKRNNNSS